jgi:transcriptional regulator of acetoin/glycerol metabolism
MILARGSVLEAGDFGLPAESRATSESLALDALERDTIRRALEKHGGNISHAARALGLTRPALYRRMEKHGL